MRRAIAAVVIALVLPPAQADSPDLATRPSKYSVAETAERLEAAIATSGVYKVFYRLDHAANAAQDAGVALRPSRLILFGNPKGGAPLMQDAPTLALDLPNRALVWEDAAGKVWITYNEMSPLFARHGLKRTDEQVKAIEARQRALFDKAGD
jgi:uncharacterized protein (DUF302 family)